MTETITNTLYCYAHPSRETTLRCKRCERPICASCAQRTPTGYLCKDCVNQHKKMFDTALWYDYLTGSGATFILSLIASGLLAFISSFIGFFMIFVSFAVAGGAGVFLSNVVLRVTGKRRSRWLFIACAAGVALGDGLGASIANKATERRGRVPRRRLIPPRDRSHSSLAQSIMH